MHYILDSFFNYRYNWCSIYYLYLTNGTKCFQWKWSCCVFDHGVGECTAGQCSINYFSSNDRWQLCLQSPSYSSTEQYITVRVKWFRVIAVYTISAGRKDKGTKVKFERAGELTYCFTTETLSAWAQRHNTKIQQHFYSKKLKKRVKFLFKCTVQTTQSRKQSVKQNSFLKQ